MRLVAKETLTRDGAQQLADGIMAYWQQRGSAANLSLTVLPLVYMVQGQLRRAEGYFAVRSNMVNGQPPLVPTDIVNIVPTLEAPPPKARKPKKQPDEVDTLVNEYLGAANEGEEAKAAFGSISGPPWTRRALDEEDPMVG